MINIPIALLLYIKLVHDKKKLLQEQHHLLQVHAFGLFITLSLKQRPFFLLTDKPIAEFDKRAFKQEQFCACFM